MSSSFPQELRWLFPKVKPQIVLHVASFLCLTLAGLLALVTPLTIRWLIDAVLPAHDGYLLAVSIALIFASHEGRAALSALGGYLTFRATQRTALALRMTLLQHIDSLSAEYFDRTPVGELLYPFEGPVDEVSYFGSELLPSLLRTAVAAGVTLLAMMFLNALLTLVVVPLVPAFLAVRHRYRWRIGRQADSVQSARSTFSSFLQEHLSSVTQIQLLRQTEMQERKARELLADTVRCQDGLCKTGAYFSALSNLAVVGGMVVAIACGGWMVFRNRLTIGTLVAFYSLSLQLFDPLSGAMEMYARAQRTFASIRQIQAFLETASVLKERHPAKPLASNRPLHAVFRNVTFGYRRRSDLLHIPSLGILEGERVAVVGPNGAGKSTLVKLLARLYDVDSGGIFLAGEDVRAVTLASLRTSVFYLPAQPILFHRSVAENLRIGRVDSTRDDLQRVLQLAGLTKYLEGFPASLEEYIEPSASNLSNGERQRVAIARALLHRPRILILDEATSSLDPASEEAMLQTIERWAPYSTLIVVSHRLHTISRMRRILLMRKGRIVGDGNHAELNSTNLFYSKLLASLASIG